MAMHQVADAAGSPAVWDVSSLGAVAIVGERFVEDFIEGAP